MIFIVLGALTAPIEWDVTFFLFALFLAIVLFVARDNCIMGRAERRRAQKSEIKAKTATYNLTRAQLDALVRERIDYELKKAREDAIADATILMLTLPLEVLMDYYWTKSYYKRIPEFTGHVLEYFEKWQNGELDMDVLRKDLWEYGGVRFEEVKPN